MWDGIKRTRGPRVQRCQQEIYIKFLADHPSFAANIVTESYNAQMRNRDWQKLVNLLNDSPGAEKNLKQWTDTFKEWRYKLFARFRKNCQEDLPESEARKYKKLSSFEVKALKVMGKLTDEENLARSMEESPIHEISDDSSSNQSLEIGENIDTIEYVDVFTKEEPVENSPMFIENSFSLDSSSKPPKSKRRRVEESDEAEAPPKKSALEENTQALRQHTASIMSLADAITSLTTTIRSYMYSKN